MSVFKFTEEDYHFMRLALEESRLALPLCLPNPPVGCVLVHEREVVARGHTLQPGQAHAEIDAINHFPNRGYHGLSVYVTLEPCSFQGRTPSCALTLVARRAGKVYVALIDPHVKNRGRGIEILRKAGVPTAVGLLREQVEKFLGPYLMDYTTHSGSVCA